MPRLFSFTAVTLAVASIAVSGCAAVSSTKMNAQDARFGGVGIPYLLPKALVPVEVVVSGTQVRVDLLEPVYVGDATQVYALRYDANPFSTDTMTITVDPTTSLLKTMSIESKDETGEILKKAIATLRAESAAATETVLMQTVLDPGDPASVAEVETRIKTTLDAFVARQRVGCNSPPTKSEGCNELLALPASIDTRLDVTLMAPAASAGPTPTSSTAGAPTPGIDCSVGICYRGTLPYRVSIEALGQTRSTLVHLPNHGPLMALPLLRHAFVKTKHTVGLRNGMIESYTIDKPSSALALVSWPLDVYDALVSTTAKIVQLKIDTSRSAISLEEQQLAEAKRRKEIAQEIAKLKEAKPESAGLIAMGASRTILTIGTGRPPVLPLGAKSDGGNPQPAVGAASTPTMAGSTGTGK